MNKYSKAGLLIVTLVIPALIFTFLRFFATNHYGVPFYHPLTDSKGKVIVNNEDTLFYEVKGIKALKPDGQEVSKEVFKNKLTVVNYLPGACDDTCQITMGNLDRVYQLRQAIVNLNLLTITGVPSDSSENTKVLQSKEGWLVVISSTSDLEETLNKTLKYQTKVPGAKTNSANNKLILIDENGHIRGYYNGTDPEEANRLMAEIKILDFEKREALKK
ncbi:SCO family protein [Dyadobacter psychrotolerans]|uniref:Uncharacterized protein n=1 Tax=Dyadobacter psychrotolerans TaxID=2541721 RepID=A0A4R5DEQ4_9BACT|nr:redoxin family protein [Dyadobacter psychrotolerans]TDE12356.1 hypothetical protein E0F88_21910 [Dyadobacter psychrotolerans]